MQIASDPKMQFMYKKDVDATVQNLMNSLYSPDIFVYLVPILECLISALYIYPNICAHLQYEHI